MRIGAILIPAIIGSYFINDVMLVKSTTFLTGFVFFGDPVLKRGLDLLNYYVPNWLEYLDPRKYVLHLLLRFFFLPISNKYILTFPSQ